jgi:glycosyltransferase involved in cell wall biosynthesis
MMPAPKANGFNGRYCAIIPAYQAAQTIAQVVRRVKQHGVAAIVIDDGSVDQTVALATEAGALVISHLHNEGKGKALRTGFDHALRAGFDGIITLDSDGQHDPEEIPALIRAGEVQHAGLVLGNRMGSSAGAMPPLRRVINRVMSRLISLLTRQPIPDSQCGFRLLRRELLQAISPLSATRYDIETEIILAAAAKHWKIISVPVKSLYDPKQHRSHIRPARDTWRFLALLARRLSRRP